MGTHRVGRLPRTADGWAHQTQKPLHIPLALLGEAPSRASNTSIPFIPSAITSICLRLRKWGLQGRTRRGKNHNSCKNTEGPSELSQPTLTWCSLLAPSSCSLKWPLPPLLSGNLTMAIDGGDVFKMTLSLLITGAIC